MEVFALITILLMSCLSLSTAIAYLYSRPGEEKKWVKFLIGNADIILLVTVVLSCFYSAVKLLSWITN